MQKNLVSPIFLSYSRTSALRLRSSPDQHVLLIEEVRAAECGRWPFRIRSRIT
jgi:hypothetical protein